MVLPVIQLTHQLHALLDVYPRERDVPNSFVCDSQNPEYVSVS